MRETPDEILAGIEALEAAAAHMFVLDRLQTWEGLSPGQRCVALVAASLEYLHGRPATSIEISQWVGIPISRVEKVFEGVEHPPYYWSEIPNTKHWAFLPAQALEYGAQ